MSGRRLTKEQIDKLTLDEAIQALPPKRRILLTKLPEYNWDITKAGLACDYAKSYAETSLCTRIKDDVLFCKAMALKQAQIAEMEGIDVAWWLREVVDGLRRCKAKGDETNCKGYADMVAKHVGAYERDNSQRGSDTFAALMLRLIDGQDAQQALPVPCIDAELVERDPDDG